MMNTMLARMSATVLLMAGFAAGVMWTISCGGSGSGSALAQGTLVERHMQATSAVNVQGPGGDAIQVTYTPPDPADVVLRVRVRGTYSTTYNNMFGVDLTVTNGAGDLFYGSERFMAPSDTNRPFMLCTNLSAARTFTGSGAPDGSYRIRLSAISGAAGTDIDFGACVLEVVTLRGVTVLDPSPWL